MKRILGLAAACMLLLAVAGWSQSRYVVKAGSDAGLFSVTKNNNPVATNVSMDSALAAIRGNAMGDPVVIRFGEAGADSVLDIGDSRVVIQSRVGLAPAWGDSITLEGSIKAGVVRDGSEVVSISGSTDLAERCITSSINITMPMDEGLGTAMSVRGNVSVRILYGTLSGRTCALSTSANQVRIEGGTFTSAINRALYISGGEAIISGGKFETKDAITTVGIWTSKKVSISGTAELTSNGGRGALEIGRNGDVSLEGGKLTNTAEGGCAVIVSGSGGKLTLAGTTPPQIAGNIATTFPGAIRTDASFKPGANKYVLEPTGSACVDSAVAVVGGGGSLSAFTFDSKYYELVKKGEDIIVKLKNGIVTPKYVITGDTASAILYTAVSGADTVARKVRMDVLLDSVKLHAEGRPCGLQFGNGNTFLNTSERGRMETYISSSTVGGFGWGRISLSGKVAVRRLYIGDGISLENNADIVASEGDEINNYIGQVHVFGSDFTQNGGVINARLYNEGTASIKGGSVVRIDNGGSGSLIVTGGTVGDTTRQGYAIYNFQNSQVFISGTANIISKDTSTANNGTIRNGGGSLIVSGGKVSNVNKSDYSVAINSGYIDGYTDTAATVLISDSAQIFSSNKANVWWGSGVIVNGAGVMEISGGKVFNAVADSAGPVVFNNQQAKLKISGSADISSNATVNPVAAVYSQATGGWSDSSGGALEITGGKIGAKAGYAVYVDGRAVISGAADVTTASPYGAVYVASGSELYLLGGTVSTAAPDSVKGRKAIDVFPSGKAGRAGIITMGGSPTINGRIGHSDFDGYTVDGIEPITVLTTGASAFAPGGRTYTVVIPGIEGRVIVKNGVAFLGNFVLDTAGNAEFRLAANGDDIVATKGRTREVKFNIMGAAGTAPAPITVVDGGTLGEAAKPATEGYVSADKHKNDGKWHIAGVQSANGEWTYSGNEFKFGAGNNGTDVNNDMTLLLKWTDEIVSVLAGDREIPATSGPSVAAIAPVVVTAGELTAGPNPSAKQSGKVSFFWNGAPLKSGKLTIFDAAGKAVAKITVIDNAAGKRQVAVWNLKDAKGRLVSDGTYVAKGVVNTKSGKTEKVSILLGVR